MVRTYTWKELDKMTPDQRLDVIGVDNIKNGRATGSTYTWLSRKFYSSAVWRRFSSKYTKQHRKCSACGSRSQAVHHIPPYDLASTVIQMGFMEPLLHPEWFTALCFSCHSKENPHPESIPLSRTVDILARRVNSMGQ